MEKKVVIFLLGSPFNARHAERIGVDQYKSSNIEFFVWECLFSNSTNQRPIDCCSDIYENVIRITSIRSVSNALRSLRGHKAIFIDSLGVDFTSRLTRSIIKQKGHKIGLLKIQHLLKPRTNFIISAYKRIRSINGLAIRTINALMKITLPQTQYDFLIFAGSMGCLNSINHRIETCTFDVATHNCCDVFRLQDTRKQKYGNRYIVFLDNGSYVHPDTEECHLYIKGEKKDFANKLKVFFNEIEKKIGGKVIIAAHPKIPREHYSELYTEFQVEFNKTASLVKGAVATCMISSNSMGFAVLSKKPMIIITDDNHVRSYIGDYQNKASKVLGCPIYNIDDGKWVVDLPELDENKYDNFLTTYMSSRAFSSNETVWLPFISGLLNNEI